VSVSWALYDFANTIFSYAVVSYAFGLWLTDPQRLGQAQGQLWQSIAILSSVGLNALVSPILGAISDRGGRRLPYLLVFTVLCIVPSAFISAGSAGLGIVLFVLANFGYQAALIYYDATLKTVSRPAARGGLSGFGVSIGYLGTIFIALLLLVLARGRSRWRRSSSPSSPCPSSWSSASRPRPATASASATWPPPGARWRAPSMTRGPCPAWAASCWAASSIRTPSTR
jgi:MFS-type transporter involved in bile tolerance (Atg22 family)